MYNVYNIFCFRSPRYLMYHSYTNPMHVNMWPTKCMRVCEFKHWHHIIFVLIIYFDLKNDHINAICRHFALAWKKQQLMVHINFHSSIFNIVYPEEGGGGGGCWSLFQLTLGSWKRWKKSQGTYKDEQPHTPTFTLSPTRNWPPTLKSSECTATPSATNFNM